MEKTAQNESGALSVLMIGSDSSIFEAKSPARQKIIEYGQLADRLQVIIFTKRRQGIFSPTQISPRVFLYPTNSFSRWCHIFNAWRLARKMPPVRLISAQDPFEAGLAGFLIKRRTGAALQLQIHTDFLSPHFSRGSWLNRIRVRLAKFLLPRAESVRVVSQRIKNSLRENNIKLKNEPIILPISTTVIQTSQPAEVINLHQKYPQFNFIVLMASRLTPEKNIGLAIEAMAEIVKKHPQTGLIIFGRGKERKSLLSLVARKKLSANIIFEPWTENLSDCQKTADLFLLTSNYEGYGMAIISALAAGCPVVMTDVGCAGEIVKNNQNGLVVPVGDSAALAAAILEMMNNNSRREQFKKQGQEAVKNLPTKEQYLMEYKKSWKINL
ncbi:MAG: Glycosyltransferase [Parcubacteria group bacterium GW2011_GWC2_42_6]|nr:MAG: Glycosyltransferase [Parcubacteria group bacterium GW2011_GWC2_42_6]